MDPATGGVAAFLRNLLPALDRINIHSEVVCFDAASPASVEQEDGFVLHRIGPASGRWGKLSRFDEWLELYAGNFDVIILHGLWLYNGYAYTKWMRRRRKQPHVHVPRSWVMPHGMLDPWFQHVSGRRLKAIRNRLYWWLIERHTIASADMLIFTSEAERDKASLTFAGYNPRRSAILQLGVPDPLESISSASGHQFGHHIYHKSFMLALGRIDPKKGFDLLPEVWRRLSKDPNYRDKLPHLIIAGPGWDSLYGRNLKQLIASLALENHISTIGMLEGTAKWNVLFNSEALIMPSHQENFGLVAVEALASATPVLISNQVDIHPLMLGGRAGFSDADTEEGMERLLRRWLDLNLEARNQMKENARNLFLDQFEICKTATRFKHLLDEIES